MADELELDVEEEPKSKKKLIIAIVVVVVLLINVVAGWFFLSGSDDGGENEEGKVETTKLPIHYLTLVPEFVVNFGPGSRVRYLQIDIQISTRDESALATIATYKPVIRNDILVLLSSLSFDELSQEAGKIKLQKKILNAINKVVVDARHVAPAEDETEDNNETETASKTKDEHATKSDSSHGEVVAGPIENVYFVSFIMQ